MSFQKIIVLAIMVLAVAAVALGSDYFFCSANWCRIFRSRKISAINNFEECAAAGFPVTLSYPSTCAAGGKTFTENIGAASGISGKVVLGPVCPVERIPPDPRCAPRPYQTQVDIFLKDSPANVYKIVKSDENGIFSAALPPGDYILKPQSSGNFYPRCSEQEVIISAGKYENLTINCDTGIR